MGKPAILHLDGVMRQFSNATAPAVRSVTLTLHEGDILGLLGSSGCGKTTLLRLIAGFDVPQAGIIVLEGQPVAGAGHWVPPEHRDVGMVFQDYALFPHLTVFENVTFGLESPTRKQRLAKRSRDLAMEAIALVGLTGLEQRYPHELSGGQQQRVALARALAPRPSLVLLDEPLSNLDVQVRMRLRQEIRQILKTTGTSAIFVTHDQEEALALADWVAVMRHGQIEQWGTPEVIYQEPASRFVAEFVTQANFVSAQQQGATWQTEIGSFPILQMHCTCKAEWEICQTDLAQGSLMIRQEDLAIVPDLEGMLEVCDRRFLGREYGYTLKTPSGEYLLSRNAHTPPIEIGTRVRPVIAETALRFFPAVDVRHALVTV